MQTLHAIDLTESPALDSLWRPGLKSRAEHSSALGAASDFGLPDGGFSSPLGFYFAEAPNWSNGSPPFRVEFFDREDLKRQTRHRDRAHWR